MGPRADSLPPGKVPRGCHWVPLGATQVAPMMRKVVAPGRCLRRLDLGKLVVVKCHSGYHLVPLGPDHSPPPWHPGAPRRASADNPQMAARILGIAGDAPAHGAGGAEAGWRRLFSKCLGNRFSTRVGSRGTV